MKFLILNEDYPEFIYWLYRSYPGLEKRSYDEQMKARAESLFGVADFYSRNLKKLGHEAWEIHCNNEIMQKRWAKERDFYPSRAHSLEGKLNKFIMEMRPFWQIGPMRGLKPLLNPLKRFIYLREDWFYEILAAQIFYYQPDVIINQAIYAIKPDFLKEMKRYTGLIVGQIASPIPEGIDFKVYDLIITSLPNMVDYFRNMGIPCELNGFAFDEAVLSRLMEEGKSFPVSFVGSLSPAHRGRISLLEFICDQMDIKVWATGVEMLSKKSPILKRYMGHAWGIEMYRILNRSKITLNNHIEIAGPYANNMRLYEATGVGTLLITDWKENLPEIFEPGKEVVTYRNREECLELIRYYLDHEEERSSIARAGQRRTLRDHTYLKRMKELSEIVERYIRG
jgi:hypothetical protein